MFLNLSNSRLYVDVCYFSLFFSILFCFFCSLVDGVLSFWVFLELCGLSIVPCFFYSCNSGIYSFYSSLLTYIIMSGFSSVLLVCGILFCDLYYFLCFGFLVKFGLFPFMFWVYRVFGSSNWVFIFFLSVVLKFPILFFCYLFNTFVLYIVYFDCIITIIICSFMFWVFGINWEVIWCNISLSSVSTLLVSCFCSGSGLCWFIYFYYVIWAGFCILYFYNCSCEYSVFSNFWFFCFVLLVTPVSLPLFYKLSVCLAIFYSSFYLLFVWSVYSFSEQFFLYKLASNYFYSGIYNSWLI